MKKIFTFGIIVFLLILNSCTKKDLIEEIATQPPTSLNGNWTLTKITGGFAGVDQEIAGNVNYNFNTTTGILTVTNNQIGTSIAQALANGTYVFSTFGENGIKINTEDATFSITGGTLLIDQNHVADGFVYTFQRPMFCGTPPCYTISQAYVNSAIVPVTGIVNNQIQIPIKFSVNNGCGNYGNLTETNVANTKTLTVYAQYLGCVCTQVIGEVITNYTFTPTTTGLQIIKIAQPDGTFLSYSINIQ